MWKEYAVEPAALTDYMQLRYVVEKFGFSKGRLLSQFPSDWFRDMHAIVSVLPDIQRKRAIKLLEDLKSNGAVKFGRSFDPSLPWLDNALREHESRPFRAIVSSSPLPNVVSVDELTEEYLECKLADMVVATAENLCAPMEFLLRHEQSLIMVDPYWRFEKEANRKVLQRMISLAKNGKCRKFNFVTRGDNHISHCEIKDLLKSHFRQAIDEGFSFRVYIFDDALLENRLHARYLIGHHAGLRYDKGFAVSPKERVEIGILQKELHAELSDIYLGQRHPCFADSVIIDAPEVAIPGFRFGGNRTDAGHRRTA